MKYFEKFPRVYYSLNKYGGAEVVTNIITRIIFDNNLKSNTLLYYTYNIQDGDTPEIIAHKFYKSVDRHWIVILFNLILDPQFDWPLSYNSFNNFIIKKYGSINYAQTNIHSHYKTVSRFSDSINTLQTIHQISEYDYNNLIGSELSYTLQDKTQITELIEKSTKTFYEYELEVNESKRSIKLLKQEFVSIIEKEFQSLL